MYLPFLYQAQCCLDIIRQCGVVPVVISQINGRDYAVVNVNTFEDVDSALLKYFLNEFASCRTILPFPSYFITGRTNGQTICSIP